MHARVSRRQHMKSQQQQQQQQRKWGFDDLDIRRDGSRCRRGAERAGRGRGVEGPAGTRRLCRGGHRCEAKVEEEREGGGWEGGREVPLVVDGCGRWQLQQGWSSNSCKCARRRTLVRGKVRRRRATQPSQPPPPPTFRHMAHPPDRRLHASEYAFPSPVDARRQ